MRGFDYYTGMRVQGYVQGAALPILQGGRYDGLLARYGRSSPAVGFAIDVEATAVALEQAAAPVTPAGSNGNGARDGGVLVAGPAREALALVERLRASGRRAALATFEDGLPAAEIGAYSRRWHFSEVRHVRLSPGSSKKKRG